jgi:hypothetical protein
VSGCVIVPLLRPVGCFSTVLLAACSGGSNAHSTTQASGSSTSGGGTSGTGGSNAAGGTPSKGGTASTAGTVSAGGTAATGSSTTAGGSTATNGTRTTDSTTSTGGANSPGGAATTGGAVSTGQTGATGGTTATGATTSNAGTTATGGTTSTIGATNTGGSAGNTTAAAGGTSQGGGSGLSDPSNIRNLGAYAAREVFLVSDADWRVVLPLVPVAVWQAATDADYAACPHAYGGARRTCAIPTLVFHQENKVSDLDASVNFLDRYGPTKISYSGTLPTDASTLLSSKFILAAAPNPLSYWSSWKTAVHVKADYPLALVASELASIENAPLLIKGFNDNIDLSGKTLLCVGLTDASCNVSYGTALDVERRIVELAPSDKLLLTVPGDLSTKPVASSSPISFEKTSGTLGTLYAAYSLAAPFLASAKQEVLLAYTDTNRSYQAIDLFLTNAISSIPVNPVYLTIVASPNHVPASRHDYCVLDRSEPGCTTINYWSQVDGAIYGDLNGDYFQDIAVGRLGGFSVSDVSAYIASDLFYDRLSTATQYLNLLSFANYGGAAIDAALFIARAFSLAGLTGSTLTADYNETFPSSQFVNKSVIFYAGHGSTNGGQNGFDTDILRSKHIWFQSSLVAAYGCSTCANDTLPPESQSFLFCNDVIRRGALAFVGAVDEDSTNSVVGMNWLRYLAKGEDLGTAFKHASNLGIADYSYAYSPYNTLLGDPTFSPAFAAASDVDLAHVSVAGPSTPVDGRVTQTVTVTLDPITTQSYTAQGAPDVSFTYSTGPSFAGDYVESSSVGYLQYPSGASTIEMPCQTFNLGVAVPNPTNRTFVRVSHAERVVGGETVDMTATVFAQRMVDIAGSSYFYIGINDLGPPGAPLIPLTPQTTPAVTLTIALEFQQ